jgi:O-antigen ligase
VKLHRILFYLLLVFLPVQLGRHFWPDFAFVSGIRVDYLSPTVYLTDLDYLSPTVYLTDLLVIGILGAWIYETRNTQYAIRKFLRHHCWVAAIFVYLLITSLFAQNSGAALYKLVKIVEFSLLGLYVAKQRYTIYEIRYTLSIAITYSSLIALTQFIKQSSLNGIFWFLGERTFNLSTPGIARAVWGGQLILRPYATFPHPNALAGFTLVALILLLGNFKSANLPRRQAGQLINKLTNLKFEIEQLDDWIIRGYWLLVLVLGLTAIAISFSRTAWIVSALIGFWWATKYLKAVKTDKKNLFIIPALPAGRLYSLFIILILVALSYCALNLSTEEAVVQRLDLARAAILMIKQNPVIGVGLNNFIPRLLDFWPKLTTTRFLQPVHNIFLLVLAETGLIGLLIFLWFLYLTVIKAYRRKNFIILYSLFVILSLGLFDHYWLTLQQTQLLFTIVLGLSWGKD